MAIGERIRFFRNLKGYTQKGLGQLVGFSEKTADIRIAQYEAGTRTPKADMINTMAANLDVSPLALNVPDIDTELGLIHTLFAIEDLTNLKIDTLEGTACLRVDPYKSAPGVFDLLSFINRWQEEAARYRNGEITKEEYDRWRYTYPEAEAQQTRDRLDALRKERVSKEE